MNKIKNLVEISASSSVYDSLYGAVRLPVLLCISDFVYDSMRDNLSGSEWRNLYTSIRVSLENKFNSNE